MDGAKAYSRYCKSETSSLFLVVGRCSKLGRSLSLRSGGLFGNKDPGASRKKRSENLHRLKGKGSSAMIINRGLVDTKNSGKLRLRMRNKLIFLYS
jgi:hypothetical protein